MFISKTSFHNKTGHQTSLNFLIFKKIQKNRSLNFPLFPEVLGKDG